MDFSPSFTAGVTESFPQAAIIYDRFHFMQFVGKAVNETRMLELKNNTSLKGSKYLWLQNPDTLSEEKRTQLETLKTHNKHLAEAYQMKENIKEFFEKTTRSQAELFLHCWCEWVTHSAIEPMKKVVKTIQTHWQ
jgi:transposase